MEVVRIAVLGDFNPTFAGHVSLNASLQHAAEKLHLNIQSPWVPTDSLSENTTDAQLEQFDGLWASPGSPYRSFDGMLRGIEFARRRQWPFVGT